MSSMLKSFLKEGKKTSKTQKIMRVVGMATCPGAGGTFLI
jgi:hypothetical protein